MLKKIILPLLLFLSACAGKTANNISDNTRICYFEKNIRLITQYSKNELHKIVHTKSYYLYSEKLKREAFYNEKGYKFKERFYCGEGHLLYDYTVINPKEDWECHFWDNELFCTEDSGIVKRYDSNRNVTSEGKYADFKYKELKRYAPDVVDSHKPKYNIPLDVEESGAKTYQCFFNGKMELDVAYDLFQPDDLPFGDKEMQRVFAKHYSIKNNRLIMEEFFKNDKLYRTVYYHPDGERVFDYTYSRITGGEPEVCRYINDGAEFECGYENGILNVYKNGSLESHTEFKGGKGVVTQPEPKI